MLGLNRAEKLQLLGERSPLGAYLSPAELNRLSKVCSIVRFSEGKPIRANSPFYLVVDGVVAVMDDDEVTQSTSVHRCTPHAFTLASRSLVHPPHASPGD